MTLENSRRQEALRVLLAFGINLAFLALIIGCFSLRYETNDDLLMSKFVDGQLSTKSAHVPFINITLGAALKLLYTVGGDSINWWSVCEYGAVLLGMTAITWVLLKKFRLLPALTMTAIILLVFGGDSYLSMNFSKASAAATVGGLALMLCAMKNESGRVWKTPLILGFLLGIYGFVWRFEEFFACAAIIAGLGLYSLIEIFEEQRGESLRIRTKSALLYALPFALILLTALALFGVNHLAWTNAEYGDYYTFDWTRSILIDSYVPAYSEMPQAYDAVGMDESAIKLFKDWAFYDTEKFTTASLQSLIDARADLVDYPSVGECVGIFFDKCLKGFLGERPIAGFLFMLALFFTCGKRGAKDWVAAAWLVGVFFVMYLAFIFMNRHLVNRIDIGLFLAMSVGLCFLTDPERLKDERILCTVMLLLCLFTSYRSARSVCRLDSHNTIEDKSREKAAAELIMQDTEHLYFFKYLSVRDDIYAPFEIPPHGYADKLVMIGGWSCRHPEIEGLLTRNGITNPYADIIGSDRLYLIDYDIETTMAYINKYHSPTACAEPVEPQSTDTGLKIYRILD